MANTFSDVVDLIFARSLLALRANVTLPRLIRTDWNNEVAAQGDTINVPLPPGLVVTDVTPSNVPLAQTNHTRNKVAITLSNWRKTSMTLTDKEAREIADGAREGDVSAVMAVLSEDVNATIMAKYKEVYGTVGTGGLTPFSADLNEAILAQKVLFEQKAPLGNRAIVLGGAAQANALNLTPIQNSQFRGNASKTMVDGQIGSVLGFDWYADQQVATHTVGTITTGLISKAATAVALGATSLIATTAAVTGACAMKAGDIFNIAGDTQTYVLAADATQAVASTDVTLTFTPGLKIALTGSEAITEKNVTGVVNLAFHRDAFALASRPLAPADGFQGGNEIRSEMDPMTGLGFTLEVSRQTNQTLYQWSILFGVKCIRPDLACRIMG